MSEFVRCSSGDASPAWTCLLPAGHDDGHIYSPWSQIVAMAEAEIRLRESAIQKVRNIAQHHLQAGAAGAASGVWVAQEILAALGGGSDER